jgi:sec-independent protein translocase protein TatA
MLEGLFQPTHLIIIFAIALLVFGPKKLPELGKGLGEGIRALKEGMKDHSATSAEPTKAPDSKETKA